MAAGLTYSEGRVEMVPGVYDVHGHPRAFDPLPDGKAGLRAYTETALKSGITLMNFMPNEFYRELHPETGESKIVQFPISNPDRARMMEMSIRTQSVIKAGYNVGIDRQEVMHPRYGYLVPNTAYRLLNLVAPNAMGFKGWVDESTGGMNVQPSEMASLLEQWNRANNYPGGKVATLHAEDGNVGRMLDLMYERNHRGIPPIHIAHVSSREELEAIIIAKQANMNVTCEATPHHLFATAEGSAPIGGFGCMKPTLKKPEDVQFLWDNMHYIDIIASDCAPHREEEKQGDKPAYGVTNHTVMMSLLLGAVEEGRLSMEDLYLKTVINPRRRFNLPLDDGTVSVFDLNQSFEAASEAEAEIDPEYGQNIFPHLEAVGQEFHLAGKVALAVSGESAYTPCWGKEDAERFNVSLGHLVLGK